MDHITLEETKAIMGFCDFDEEWWPFTLGEDSGVCPKCGALPSKQIGFQVMTQRTFNPQLHGKKKAKKKR